MENKKKYWEIQQGEVDTVLFFKLIIKFFPNATTFFAEGTSIANDVKKVYEAYQETGNHLPGTQTLFPNSNKFRCRFSPAFVEEMVDLAGHYSEFELLDHLSLYMGDECLLDWHDAFANIIILPGDLSEDLISAFCKELGVAYEVIDYDKKENGNSWFYLFNKLSSQVFGFFYNWIKILKK